MGIRSGSHIRLVKDNPSAATILSTQPDPKLAPPDELSENLAKLTWQKFTGDHTEDFLSKKQLDRIFRGIESTVPTFYRRTGAYQRFHTKLPNLQPGEPPGWLYMATVFDGAGKLRELELSYEVIPGGAVSLAGLLGNAAPEPEETNTMAINFELDFPRKTYVQETVSLGTQTANLEADQAEDSVHWLRGLIWNLHENPLKIEISAIDD
jgi:hypothetical protein